MLINFKNVFGNRIFSKQVLKKVMVILILEVSKSIVSSDSIAVIISGSIFCALSTFVTGDVSIQSQTDIEELKVQP